MSPGGEQEPISRALQELPLLQIDLTTAEVVQALEAAGIPAILLKGPSIRRWLYDPEELRAYGDSDLLVPPQEIERGVAVAERLGFRRMDFGTTRFEADSHHEVLFRQSDGRALELHRTLFGIGVPDDKAWSILQGEREPMHLGIEEVVVASLTVSARAFFTALHAAAHGEGVDQPLQDLERALERAAPGDWEAAAELAERLEAIPSFVGGLELLPAGEALVRRLRLPRALSVETELRRRTPPPTAVGFDHLARTRGIGRKALFLLREFFPPKSYVRDLHGISAGEHAALAGAYARRAVGLFRQAPRGFLAWRRAARRARER